MGNDRFSPEAFAAGSIAGAGAVLIGYPLDTLKVYAQSGLPPPSYRSLLRGVTLPMLSAGAVQSVTLGFYENVRRKLWPGPEPSPLWCVALAGSIAGVTVTMLTTPLSRIKILQQTTGRLAALCHPVLSA